MFYHTDRLDVRSNTWSDCQYGVFVDAAETFNDNTVRGTKATPTVMPPSDGTAVNLADPVQAAAYRNYNGMDSGDFLGAVIFYNMARSVKGNHILDNAWDGIQIAVDSFFDFDGTLSENEVLRNGRHGFYVAQQPRGDTWGSNRRIYMPIISGGKIAGNMGHAVCLDGRYVEQDLSVTYESIRGCILRDLSVMANGGLGWHDEDGVKSCIMKVHHVASTLRAMLHNVSYVDLVQGSPNVTINGLYVIDDRDGSPGQTNELVIIGCDLGELSGLAIRAGSPAGHRRIMDTFVSDVNGSVSLVPATQGSLHIDVRDRNGAVRREP